MKPLRPLKAMRANCLECSGDGQKYIKFCPCDGLHSTRCEFWPYRFGKRPETVEDQRLVIPECMPDEAASLESLSDEDLKPLPAGYKPRKQGRKLTDEQRQAAAERLRKMRETKSRTPSDVA